MATSAARKWGHGALKMLDWQICRLSMKCCSLQQATTIGVSSYCQFLVKKKLPGIGVSQPVYVFINIYIQYIYICICLYIENQKSEPSMTTSYRSNMKNLYTQIVRSRVWLSSISQLVSPTFWSSKPVISDQPVNTSMKSFTSVLEQVPVIWNLTAYFFGFGQEQNIKNNVDTQYLFLKNTALFGDYPNDGLFRQPCFWRDLSIYISQGVDPPINFIGPRLIQSG